MKEQLFEALSGVCQTFQYAAPQDNEELPVLIYEVTNEKYGTTEDDKQANPEFLITVKLYDREDDENRKKQAETALKEAFLFCYLENKQETKEDGLFLTIFTFKIHEL